MTPMIGVALLACSAVLATLFVRHKVRRINAAPMPLTYADVQAEVAKIKYRGWMIRTERRGDTPILYLKAPTTNVNPPHETPADDYAIQSEVILPLFPTIDRLHRFVVECICQINQHETLEHFLVDGVKVLDPHNPLTPMSAGELLYVPLHYRPGDKLEVR